MVVEKKTARIEHYRFADLPSLILPQDLLVLNDTRVFPARLQAVKESTGARLEVLLLRRREGDLWEALVKPGRRVRSGTRLIFESGKLEAELMDEAASAKRLLRFEYTGDFWSWIERLGEVPLPPYIERRPGQGLPEDRDRYQTVFAHARGSVAAPTAGLHFTPNLLTRLRYCRLTLHVGYGTFKPIASEKVEQHQMEAEEYEISEETAARIREQMETGGRVIAVGTTSTRVLEHLMLKKGRIVPGNGWTDLFIYPGFHFKAVQGLITNFHLPRSTLLLLISAFAGRELIEKCYREAIRHRYRFYSYGDAMLVL